MPTLTKPKPKMYANSSWTMAIASQSSALSRWWGKSLSKVSGFTLQLIPVGDNADAETPKLDGLAGQSVNIQGNQAQLEGFAQLTEQYVRSSLGRTLDVVPPVELPDVTVAFWGDTPEWQSDSGYSHRLYLGALQVEPIVRDLKVTTTQLYDLAEILQQSLAEAQPLPSGSVRVLPERSPTWSKTAAVAAIALSLTGGVAWLIGGESVFQTASESESEELVSLDRPQGAPPGNNPLNLPPNFQVKPTTPTPETQPTKPPAKTTKPSPLKDNATAKTTNDSLQTAIAQKKLSQPAAKSDENKTTVSSKPTSKKTLTSSTSSEKSQVSETTDLSANKEGPKIPPFEAKPETELTPDKPESLAESADVIAGAPAPSTEQRTVAVAPPIAPEPVAPSAPAKAANAPVPPPASAPSASDFSIAGASRRQALPSASPSTETVLRFFQSGWQGQDALNQSLLYTIVVKPDGSVLSVTPKDNLAQQQLSRAPLPSPGDALIPPFSGAGPATFNVTLYPDGTVSVN